MSKRVSRSKMRERKAREHIPRYCRVQRKRGDLKGDVKNLTETGRILRAEAREICKWNTRGGAVTAEHGFSVLPYTPNRYCVFWLSFIFYSYFLVRKYLCLSQCWFSSEPESKWLVRHLLKRTRTRKIYLSRQKKCFFWKKKKLRLRILLSFCFSLDFFIRKKFFLYVPT